MAISEQEKKAVRELVGEANPMKTLREMREEEAFRYEAEKFKFYEPNGKCEQFIKKVGEGGNFIVLFSAANGVGKTAAGANIVANLIWGKENDNPWVNFPMYKNFPFPKRGRIASDPTNIEKNLIPTLKEWLPEGRYVTRKGNKTYESIWKTDNGWAFDIMTYEQEAKEYESSTLGWAWFDEPPPQAIFKATVARMRKGGVIFISETPLYAAWLYDHIIANPDSALADKGQRVYIEAEVEDACKEHGIRGHLDHANIQRIIAEYTEEEKQARIYGKFQHLVGLRFKAFSPAVHVVRPFHINRQDWLVWHALDTHPRVNDAGIWIAIDRKGRKFVVDEFWEKCLGGTEEMAQQIKKKNDEYRVEKLLLEPAAFVKDQHLDPNERTLATKLQGYGINYQEATKKRQMSDKRIEDALTYQKINLNSKEEYVKAPELFIFDTCKRTIFEFEHFRWDDWSGKTQENRGLKEKTVDKDDHMLENIGRILIQEPEFTAQKINQNTASSDPDYDPFGRIGD